MTESEVGRRLWVAASATVDPGYEVLQVGNSTTKIGFEPLTNFRTVRAPAPNAPTPRPPNAAGLFLPDHLTNPACIAVQFAIRTDGVGSSEMGRAWRRGAGLAVADLVCTATSTLHSTISPLGHVAQLLLYSPYATPPRAV